MKVLLQKFKLKTELTNEHLRKMLLMMVDEQNRTEELLTTSLAQLKKSHLLLVSHGNSSDEMSEEYQVMPFLHRFLCEKIKFSSIKT